eukprot:GHUV01001179.1.p1 GENE.GHUV01001179.1~~GHUV01001179.1.p1  ORF type:complete len:365 (+),score=98.94 GHUV01001179.1:962-2056(+)
MFAQSQTSTSVFRPRGSASAYAVPARPLTWRQHRHRLVSCRAWEYNEPRWQPLPEAQQPCSDTSSAVVDQGPGATLRRVLDVVREGDLDGMLEFCPDEVIDKLLALRKETGSSDEPVHFEDILKANSEDLLYLDTYALRNLILAAPSSVQVLSAMHVTPDRYLQRCAIVSPSGEECVLTFGTTLQEVSECQYRGPPLLSKKWMLQSVTGECNSDELPAHPSPSFPPEAVVEAQLAALREGRVASVFAHASPENKASTGPVEKFAAMLNRHPDFCPLMHHVAAETVQRLQPSETTYMEVVRITPASAAASSLEAELQSRISRQQQQEPLLFMWILSRQSENSAWSHCWMTDAVRPMAAIPSEFLK